MTDEKTQIDRFKEAARELETDELKVHFDRQLKKIAKASPPAKKSNEDKPAK